MILFVILPLLYFSVATATDLHHVRIHSCNNLSLISLVDYTTKKENLHVGQERKKKKRPFINYLELKITMKQGENSEKKRILIPTIQTVEETTFD